jgi:hypothetical protein
MNDPLTAALAGWFGSFAGVARPFGSAAAQEMAKS